MPEPKSLMESRLSPPVTDMSDYISRVPKVIPDINSMLPPKMPVTDMSDYISGLPNAMVIPDINSMLPRKSSFDTAEYDDNRARYLMPDSPYDSDDAPRISYLRIVRNDDKGKVVFPSLLSRTELERGAGYSGMTTGTSSHHNRFKQFILTGINDTFQERVQISETSEKPVINFFGDRLKMLPISGMLKNSIENPWTTNMIYLWENYMRGTKLAENNWIAEFYCNNALYRGYPVNFALSIQAGNDLVAQFSLQLAVVERRPLDTW